MKSSEIGVFANLPSGSLAWQELLRGPFLTAMFVITAACSDPKWIPVALH